jgi:hypothetical protein
MTTKAECILAMNEARDNLWQELALLDDATELSPGRTRFQIFAHIAGWESWVFEALRAHVEGTPLVERAYPGIDALNHQFITQRQQTTTTSAKLECEINRFAILALLNAIPESDWEQPVRFHWGSEAIPQFIQGAINHEREHASEVADCRRRNAS